jgi:hypothetical protein
VHKSASDSPADSGRKARNRAISTGYYWLINTPDIHIIFSYLYK